MADGSVSSEGASAEGVLIPWRVVLLANGGARVAPGEWVPLHLPIGDGNSTTVLITSQYADAGLSHPVPQHLILEVPCLAANSADAAFEASAVANVAVAILSFVINGHVSIPTPYLAYESAFGLTRRRFWQAVPGPEELNMQRLVAPVEADLLDSFLRALYVCPEVGRAMRALA